MSDWSHIHAEKRFHVGTLTLALLSILYGLGVRLRLIVVKKRKKKELPGFVVSIGNLTVGGTGKTPAAITMAEWALREGYNVAVLSRGYGGHYKTKVLVVSDQHGIKAEPDRTGDEPYLIARRLKSVPVIISRDRYLAGIRAHEMSGADFFILDDGFQHLMLKRDLDLLLIDAPNPFGNGHLLPWGPLREPVKQLKRADAIIFTRCGSSTVEYDVERSLKERLDEKTLFRGDHIPEEVVFPFKKDNARDPEFLKGKRVTAFAGIARPEAFKNTLIKLGAHLVSFSNFKDHYPFSPDDFTGLVAEKEKNDAEFLITTEKDWVRLESIISEYPDLAYLKIKFAMLPAEEKFFNMVKERIEEKRF